MRPDVHRQDADPTRARDDEGRADAQPCSSTCDWCLGPETD
jgi:hypothetical protein